MQVTISSEQLGGCNVFTWTFKIGPVHLEPRPIWYPKGTKYYCSKNIIKNKKQVEKIQAKLYNAVEKAANANLFIKTFQASLPARRQQLLYISVMVSDQR